MKTIELTQGKVTKVDDENYEDLIPFKWYATGKRKTLYAERTAGSGKTRIHEKMHRRILGLKLNDGKFTDHINGNGLDNRRNNLRVCTNSENLQNREKQRNNTSGYKGVKRHEGKWVARIGVNSHEIHLGRFVSIIDAALAYNNAALKYFGEFARLNQIEESQ